MRDKGLITSTGKSPAQRATRRAWDLTGAGHVAAKFVALATRTLLDGRIDPESRPARLVGEPFDANLSKGGGGAVLTLNAGGNHADMAYSSRYIRVDQGTIL